MHGWRDDVRYALRQLRRAPGFTFVAVLTLALGIGATTAIFSAAYAVVLRPLGFREPEQLVRVYTTSPATTPTDEVSPRTFATWRHANRSFAGIAPLETRGLTLVEGVQLPQQVTAVRTTSDYFRLLGVSPLLGRTFLPEEDIPGRNGVLVLSHRFWRGRFGGDPAAVGRVVRVNVMPYRVVGVMPRAFDVSAGAVDVWTPIALTPEEETSVETGYLDVVARLRPGVTAERAQADLTALTKSMEQSAQAVGRTARVVDYTSDLVGAYRTRLLVLLGAVGLVLLIACANVANLLLARGAGQAKQIAVRAALGGSPARVMRQLLTESLVLGVIGGAAGLVLAFAALHALRAAGPEGVPRLEQAGLYGPVLAFTLLVVVASSVLFGLAPALRAAAPDLQSVLREGGRASGGVTRDAVRHALVTLEVALSVVLLVGAGLLIRSGVLLQRVDPGLDPTGVWSGSVTLAAAHQATPERVTQTFERIVGGVGALPGVRSVAVVSVPPFSGIRALALFVPEGRPIDARNTHMANLRLASPGLFTTLRIPLRQGRDLSASDAATTPPVVVVNEAFARLAWPGESALGKRLIGPGERDGAGRGILREVVGIVADVREDGLREAPRPAVYYPLRQVSSALWDGVQNSIFIVARVGGDPRSITKGVQGAVAAIDPDAPVFAVRSMEQRMTGMVATARFNTALLSALGVVGWVLAAVGIYGVISYFVGQRTHEIGVRMSLGATPANIVGLTVREGMRPVVLGVVLGTLAAVGVTRVLASQLFGVAPTDPLTLAAAVLAVGLVGVLATALPARRAAGVEPKTSLST